MSWVPSARPSMAAAARVSRTRRIDSRSTPTRAPATTTATELALCAMLANTDTLACNSTWPSAAISIIASSKPAAVSAQRRLTAELPWLKVRMALHTGDTSLRDGGNYVGMSIIRCARLRACGHGAQVLVSETTAALVADAGVGLVDLGSVRLRDLARAERVFQAVHPDIPERFPPLRSLDAAPHNLPAALTSLVGRTGSNKCDAFFWCRPITA